MTKVAMETTDIPTTQDGSHVEITNEDDAHHLLRYQRYCVHFEFIPRSQTVNQAYYVKIFTRLRETVRRKRPELWPNDWIVHHDNALANKTLFVKEFPAQRIYY
jgi:hypothetical protein